MSGPSDFDLADDDEFDVPDPDPEPAARSPFDAIAINALGPPIRGPQTAPSFGDVMEQVGQSGPGRRDYTDQTRQGAEMDAAGPSLKEAAKVIGPALLPGGAGLGFMGRTALQAGEGALTDAAITGAETEGSWQDRALAGLAAMPRGAAWGGGLSAGGDMLGGALKWLASQAGYGADLARGASISTPTMRQKLMRQQVERGAPIDEAVDFGQAALGRRVEELGLANKFQPQSAQDYARKLDGVRSEAGAGVGQALDDAGADGVHGWADHVADGLEGIRGRAALDQSGAGAPRERAAQELIDRLSPSQGPMTPRELHGRKMDYERAGGYESGEIVNLSDAATKSVNRDAATATRRELDSAMSIAPPDVRESFDLNRRKFAFADTAKTLAEDRAIHDAARNMPMLQTGALAGGGFALGGLPGMVAGPAAGMVARKYGNDAAANGLRGGQGAMEWMASQSRQAGSLGPQAIGAAHMSPGDAGRTAAAQREQAANDGRGHLMESAARQALQQNPQALGQYAPRFQEAAQSGDAMKMTALIAELNRDPQFRMTVGQDLLRMTNPRQGASSQ